MFKSSKLGGAQVVIALERDVQLLGQGLERAKVVTEGGHGVVRVELFLNLSAELDVPVRPVGAALGGTLLPLGFSRDVRNSASGAKVHLVLPVTQARPGDRAGLADDDRAGPAALAEVHWCLALRPCAFERVVRTMSEIRSQRP